MRISRSLWLDLSIVLLVTMLSSVVAYHNVMFGSPFDSPDIRAHEQNVLEWIRNGTIPFRGQGTSYSGWGTPGTTFLMLPGVLLTSDWRLHEIPGAVLLHAGTLLFIYFLLKDLLGRGAALAAVVIAGFSPLTGPTLWPNGHPFFVVAMLFFLVRWARNRQAWALAAALFTLGFGLYVYPTIAPAAFAIPIIWLVYRPPIAWRWVALVSALLVVLWAPFLVYESGNSFLDLKSMILRRDTTTGTAQTPTYCYAVRIGEADAINNIYAAYLEGADPGRMAYAGGGALQSAAYRGCVFLMHIDENFDAGWLLLGANEWADRILYAIFLVGVFALLGAAWRGPWAGWPFWRLAVPIALLGAAVLWLVIAPTQIADAVTHDSQARMNLRNMLEQARIFLPVVWCALVFGLVAGGKSGIDRRSAGVIAGCILLSCVVMALVGEPDRPWRFWWLWPLQTIGLIAGAAMLGRALSPIRWIGWIALAGVLILTFPVARIQMAANDIARNGLGGRDSGQLSLMSWLADEAHVKNTDTLSISVTRFQADDDTTRPGGWLDFGLKYSYGITNTNSGGPAEKDNFRLLDYRKGVPQDLALTCPWDGWRIVFQSARLLLCAPPQG
jgi:hypothetical protein